MPQSIDISTIVSILGLGAAGISIYSGLRNSEDLKHIKELSKRMLLARRVELSFQTNSISTKI